MNRHILTTIATLICILSVKAQTTELYTGTLNENIPITLYLIAEENACTTDTMYRGMYQYDGKSKWIQLDITTDKKTRFVLVEYNFTGVLILEKSNAELNGIWISPDYKKQLEVKLHKTEIPKKRKETLENDYEEVNYENYDC